MPQKSFLLDDTIKKNIALGLKDDEIDQARIDILLNILDLKEFVASLKFGIDTKVGELGNNLSGGQRQRVGIARAIIKNPLLLLADEPVASLDPKAADLILSLLKKINKEYGTTILCNLHQVDLAKKYSDRIVGLIDGKVIFNEKSTVINKNYLEKIYS